MLGCVSEFSPKPKGYPRFDLPTPAYQAMQEQHPYFFEYSKYAIISADTTRFTEPHWIDIRYPQWDAVVQLTYKAIDKNPQKLIELTEDARKLVNKHQIKASGIEEFEAKTKKGHKAYLFKLSGQVPSQFQFYTTDSVQHFLRGALYFNTSTQNDSLAPAIDYITNDMIHMLNSLEWRNLPQK